MDDRAKFTVRLRPETHAALTAYAEDHRYPMNTVLEALVQLFNEADDTQRQVVLDRAEQIRRSG